MLVRGLDYYTHTAFELESPSLGAQSALAGGGRYDYLATELGSKQPVPAVGFAAGMERLFIALEAAGMGLPQAASPDVYLIALGDTAQAWTTGAAQQLRQKGLSVMSDLLGRSMKAQMRDANRRGARVVTILGDDELERGVVVVRNMEAGSQEEVPLEGFADPVVRAVQAARAE